MGPNDYMNNFPDDFIIEPTDPSDQSLTELEYWDDIDDEI